MLPVWTVRLTLYFICAAESRDCGHCALGNHLCALDARPEHGAQEVAVRGGVKHEVAHHLQRRHRLVQRRRRLGAGGISIVIGGIGWCRQRICGADQHSAPLRLHTHQDTRP